MYPPRNSLVIVVSLTLLSALPGAWSASRFHQSKDDLGGNVPNVTGLWQLDNAATERSSNFPDLDTLIAGGQRVSDAGSMASLQVFKNDDWWGSATWKHICGGVILNRRWVLTTAHCAKAAEKWPYKRIVIGAANLKGDKRQEIRAKDMFVHPSWSAAEETAWTMDVALIYLAEDADLKTAGVSSAKLTAPFANVRGGNDCWVMGWGKSSVTSDFSDDLRAAKLLTITQEQCEAAYRNAGGVRLSEEFHVCAGGEGESRGTCPGDSGGPLICGENEDARVVGIAVNGPTCGSTDYPNIFIRVDKFLIWIEDTMKNSA